MTTPARSTRIPFFVPLFNPLARRMLGAGIPLGPNALLTVRGRKTVSRGLRPWPSSRSRATAGSFGTFGEVNWVRNLRAAREASLSSKRSSSSVTASELSVTEAAAFFRDTLGPYVHRVPLGRILIGCRAA